MNPDACERCEEEGIFPGDTGTRVVQGPYGPYLTCGRHEGDGET